MSRERHLVATVITLCMFGTPAHAEDDEQKENKQEKKAKKEKKADKDKDKEPKAEKKDDRIPEIGGYLQLTGQWNRDNDGDGTANPSEVRVRRLRVKVKGKVVKKVHYNVELDPLAEDFTDLLRDAYVELRHLPKHDVLIGQQKTQFGYENLESSSKLYTVNRADLSRKLARGNTTRDIGVGVIGEIPIGYGYSIEDAITVVNGAGQNTREDTSRKNVLGRLGGRFQCDDLGLDIRAGVSGGYGDLYEPEDPLDPDDFDRRYVFRRFGADVQVDHTWGFLAAEVVTGRDRDLATDVETEQSGWYVLGAGKTPWHAGPVVRFDKLEADERWTFGGYWGEVDARFRVMADYEHRKDKDDRLILWTQGRF